MFNPDLRDKLISNVTSVGGFVTFYEDNRVGVFHNDQEFSLYDEEHIRKFIQYLEIEKSLQEHDNLHNMNSFHNP